MTNKPEQINAVCSSDSQLNRLSQRAQQLNKLNYILQQVMPPQFAAHCQLANINKQTVIVHTDNASYASLLRFQAKTICSALSEHLSQPVTKLELKVRPLVSAKKQDTTAPISLPIDAAEAIQQTADSIEEGPLKSALENLTKRRQQ